MKRALMLTTAPAIPKPMAAILPDLCAITPLITHAKLATAYFILYSHHASSSLSAIVRSLLTVFFRIGIHLSRFLFKLIPMFPDLLFLIVIEKICYF